MKPLGVGLCGLGTVGCGLVALLRQNANLIAQRAGRSIRLLRVASRTAKPGIDLAAVPFSTDLGTVTSDPAVDVLVELIGGTDTAERICRHALQQGKHVVTANKALIATKGESLLQLANRNERAIRFEAAVAGGIPIVKTLTEGLSANHIHWIVGIINGTSNYILSEMTHQARNFADVLKEAQHLGYAEADPSFDVEGVDAAHKLTILAALAFHMPFRYDAVYTEGIENITPEDIEYARQLGYSIKHLGIAHRSDRGIELRVHPTLIPQKRLLAAVDGVMNAIMINSDAVGSSMYYGAGAGALPTASAVIADLVDLARHSVPGARVAVHQPAMLSIDAVESAYYLKIPAVDQPGVLARVAKILSAAGISIESVIQREQAVQSRQNTPWVPVIILTQRVLERRMNHAQLALQKLPEVLQPITRLRVEMLDSHP